MAQSSLTVLHPPHFPQTFVKALDSAVTRMLARPQLGKCNAMSPETSYAACDGEPCYRQATIHDLATDQEYCFPCWNAGRR